MSVMMWICGVIVLLVSETWSVEPGTNHSASVNSRPDDIKNLAFNLGSEAKLPCGNKTWNEIIFVIWNIQLKNKTCKIANSNADQSEDSCNDGKSLRNTSSSQSYLYIPKFSTDDVGVYRCELAYKAGNKNYVIYTAVTVSPKTSAWLERRDNKMVATCRAEKGKPAANISWNYEGNATAVETHDSDGFLTVESLLMLAEDVDTENLTCSITHPLWKSPKILVPKVKEGCLPWLISLIGVVLSVFLVGLIVFVQKKVIIFRQCKQSDVSASKSPPIEDVEEVEPYASYIQRVNSIYN